MGYLPFLAAWVTTLDVCSCCFCKLSFSNYVVAHKLAALDTRDLCTRTAAYLITERSKLLQLHSLMIIIYYEIVHKVHNKKQMKKKTRKE